jgi:hybrid cluster-associated redox disulfide protein
MATDNKHFSLDMTIAEAMAIHPRVAEVFAAFHLGGCAHCHINQVETLDQVCAGYGVDPDMLLETLEGLMEPAEPTNA